MTPILNKTFFKLTTTLFIFLLFLIPSIGLNASPSPSPSSNPTSPFNHSTINTTQNKPQKQKYLSLILSSSYTYNTNDASNPFFGIGLNVTNPNQDIYALIVASIFAVSSPEQSRLVSGGGGPYFYSYSYTTRPSSGLVGFRFGTRFKGDRLFLDLYTNVYSFENTLASDINIGVGAPIGKLKPSIGLSIGTPRVDDDSAHFGLFLKSDLVF